MLYSKFNAGFLLQDKEKSTGIPRVFRAFLTQYGSKNTS